MYFSFQGQFYEQVEVAAMGSTVSAIVANLYIKYFGQKALSTVTHPARVWLRYVDDIFVIQKEDHKNNFLEYINSGDPAIRFIVEESKGNGAIPFLDTIVKPEAKVDCISHYIGNPPTQTSIYSRTVTITYQPSTV